MFDPISLALDPPRFVKCGIPLAPSRAQPTKPFTWPLARLGNREPRVLDAHRTGERRGIELGYTPATFDRELFVPVFAANDGEVAFALEGSNGYAVSIDHGGTWTTHYTRLSKTFVIACKPRLKRRERVRAGQVIGYASNAPVRIGFELWQWTDDRGFVGVDPLPQMRAWTGAPSSIASERLGKKAA